jgi:hypothetical protein
MSRPENFFNRTGVFLILGILLACFFYSNGLFSKKKSGIIRSDGMGYYSYLPAIFIYNDYTQSFIHKKIPIYYEGTGVPEYMETINGQLVDKYFLGTAVMMYPFFITAHWLNIYFHKPADGYSFLYQYFIGLAAVFYAFLGIYFCYRLLKLFGGRTYESLFICLLILFGTNLYYYAVNEPSMSHAYSFAAISAFLFYSKGVFQNKEKSFIIPALISLGLLILIRPINVLIIFSVPFLAGSFRQLKEGIVYIFRNYLLFIAGSIIAFLIVSLQFLIWYKQAGSFLVDSYTYERFYFDRPNFINVLFSYRKGFFVYTPLCLLSLAGLFVTFRKNRFTTISFLFFFILLIYVFSCWHQWYYGASYGFRPMIEYLSLFGVLLLLALQHIRKKWIKIIFILICTAAIPVNQIQAYQYRYFILHWDRMDKFKYWKTFLKTGYKWYGYVWDNPEPIDIFGDLMSTFRNDFEGDKKGWQEGIIFNAGKDAHSGNNVNQLDSNVIFSRTLIVGKESKLTECKKPVVIVYGHIKAEKFNRNDSLFFVVSHQHADGQVYFYKTRIVDSFYKGKNGWYWLEIAMKIDTVGAASDATKMYFWNPQKKRYWIDDVIIKIFEEK